MKVIAKIKNQFVLRFERGEKFPDALLKFAARGGRKPHLTGWFTGLGALENPEIAYYDLKKPRRTIGKYDKEVGVPTEALGGKYFTKKLKGKFEVASLIGNLALLHKKSVVHIHVVLGDKQYRAYAGHLVSGIVGGTLEVHLETGLRLMRKQNKSTGLSLLN